MPGFPTSVQTRPHLFILDCRLSASERRKMATREKARSLIKTFPLLQQQFRRCDERFAGRLASPLALRCTLDGSSAVFGCLRGRILPLGCRFLASDGKDAAAREWGDEDGPEKKSSSGKVPESGKEERVSSYWGIMRPTVTRKDGTPWPWNCFMPWETYSADVSIDLSKHHIPKSFADKFAYRTVKLLRIPTDIFFQRRYGCRAMMLETVAAVPGMVGGLLLHLKSLRRFQHSGGWIRALLEEAENERMHLMTMVEMVQPKWYERALVLAVQGVFFNLYFIVYLLSPKLAHRIVGYLEEEAIHSYTEFLKEIDEGRIKNVPAPAIAVDYWRLPETAMLRDVVVAIRADEAHHRDVNHFASDVHYQGKELKEAPAPLGYH